MAIARSCSTSRTRWTSRWSCSSASTTTRTDNRWEDRYNSWLLLLPPRARRSFAFPVDEMRRAPQGREMQMDKVGKVIVFRGDPLPGRRFYVLGMTLVR